MIVGIGIDILSIARFESLLLRRGANKIAKRICTEREYTEFQSLSLTLVKQSHGSLNSPRSDSTGSAADGKEDELFQKQVRFLSCRWALKEAAYKSLSPTLHALSEINLAQGNLDLTSTDSEISSSRSNPDTSVSAALNWKDLDIIKHPSGSLVLRPTNSSYDEKYGLLASLSHDAGVVVGVVIAQLKPN
ncbi:hypothetical protein IAT40_007996 [Kwoniella sp. CBS 6097]